MHRTKIQCYASGSGCLSFTRVKPNGLCGMPVTMGDARRWLNTLEGKRLTGKNWELKDDSGHPILVKKVERVADDQLKVDGQLFTYSIDPFHDVPLMGTDNWLADAALCITFQYPEDHILGGEEYELKNISTRAAIRYFLKHEPCPTAEVGHA